MANGFFGEGDIAQFESGPGIETGLTDTGDGWLSRLGQGVERFIGTPGGTRDASGTGLLGWVDRLSPLLRTGVSVAQIPLSVSALNEAASARRALTGAVKTAQQAAGPAAAAAGPLITAGTTALTGGALPPEIEANIQDQVNQYRQTKLDELVRQGVAPDVARAQIEAEVQQVGQRLRLQWAQSLTSTGGGLAEVATGGAGAAGRLAGGEAASIETLLGQSQQAMARLLGMV